MIINIKVYPHSGKEEIEKVSESSLGKTSEKIDTYKVYLKKPALDNKANIELLKLLKRHFKVETKIIKGLTSRNKIVKLGD